MLPPGICYRSVTATCCGNRKCSMIFLLLAPFVSFVILLYLCAGTIWVVFFLVGSAIVFLVFYIHSLMEQSRRLSMISSTTYNNIDIDTGLDDREITTFPTFKYERENNSNNSCESSESNSNRWAQCAICLSILQTGETVKRIPVCKHFFHIECINKWLRLHSTCPMCRSPATSTTMRPPV
ncbi:RING-H2 finger protein ATL32 [Carex littledalei]|uniref:RING-type E3 ubiquitin transferase n=1 Tax=Carex littledalei TaxID=544730 RepID=A0A833RA01_9POAL|nr:RING-H2 finger protein ATL32 [Carex littledalei]KAF3341500.1 RING-H2 finger protein ATL32 [Carex littledalei]